MTETKFNGLQILYMVEECQGYIDYNAVKFLIDGKEVAPIDVQLIYYVDEEELDDTND